MRVESLLRLLLLADTALPTGAFTASTGWESAVRRGDIGGAADVASWLRGMLCDQLGAVELPHLARAHRAVTPWAVSRHMDRYTVVPQWRDASLSAGARLLELSGYGVRRCHRAVALGWLAACAEVPVEAAAAGHAHAALLGQAQVAVRLGVIDGDTATRLVAELAPDIAQVVARAADGRVRPSLLSRWEIAAMRHADMQPRLFAS
ncbi:MAG TPA: urease accessory UreF family protein [Candidatus Dormibacteraeota bacterium]|jgi:urease accessory protein|nr:urease accessory UreF family protein [Candidatus Dormibacteraeota bacterium]